MANFKKGKPRRPRTQNANKWGKTNRFRAKDGDRRQKEYEQILERLAKESEG